MCHFTNNTEFRFTAKAGEEIRLIVAMFLLPSATVVVERLCFHRCLSVHRREGVHPQGRHPPEMATVADGTHPTGMHSCWNYISAVKVRRWWHCNGVNSIAFSIFMVDNFILDNHCHCLLI